MVVPPLARTCLALCLSLCAAPALAEPDVLAEIMALKARLEKLESRNAELEAALASDRISEKEPELATRLKAAENDVDRLKPAAGLVETLNGIAVGASLTSVAQHSSGHLPGEPDSQLSWRGDVEVELPAGEVGNAEGKLFFHFRLGQGDGLAVKGEPPVNATAFRLLADDDASNVHAILAQAWYQMDIPLPLGGFKDRSREHLELTVGKIDPYGFFDQNDAADDETAKHLNLNFVHNPLLDVGGGAVFDEYGFTPGARIAYVNETNAPIGWGFSLGVFATGDGAKFLESFDKPFVIAQLETRQRFFGGLAGNYRLYAWDTGRGGRFDGGEEKQAGWGISADQRVGDGLTLWGRYGHSIKGDPLYQGALTLGAELSGSYWDRAADSLGVAVAHLDPSAAYRSSQAGIGNEHVVEAYYNWRATPSLVLSPDIQYLHHPSADSGNGDVWVLGLRASLGYGS